MRLVSLLMAVAVLWMLYEQLKDPATWRLIADDREISKSDQPLKPEVNVAENLVPGPNDQDDDEVAAAASQFEAIDDKTVLKTREMAAYWRLLTWSRTQPLSELENRAERDVPFTLLWEQPEKYRGKLIRIRMHVKRVLEHEFPENPLGVKSVYEAWGPTEETQTFPYVVVLAELPPGLPVGTDARSEIVFVGYFLKLMSYKAVDNNSRAAPLLMGRARLVSTPPAAKTSKSDPWIIPVVLVAAVALIGLTVLGARAKGKPKAKMLPKELAVSDSWSLPDQDNPFGQFGATQATTDHVEPAHTAESPAASSQEPGAVRTQSDKT
jgi:hypothetical protein